MKPAAFFFDLDGTLVDTESLWAQAIADALADCGQSATRDSLLPIVMGRSWLDIHAAIQEAYPSVPRMPATDAADFLRPYYTRLAGNGEGTVIRSSVEFLKHAAKIAPCAIVSGSPHADVEKAAEICGISHLLSFVLGAEDYGRGKPAPDGYLKAAAMLEVDASECVAVEDSAAGVRSGRTAGMRVIGLRRQSAVPQDLSGCEWLVDDLSELDLNAVF